MVAEAMAPETVVKKPNPNIAFTKAVVTSAIDNATAVIRHPVEFAKGVKAASKSFFDPQRPSPRIPYTPQFPIPAGMMNDFDWQTNLFAKEGRSVMPQYALGGDTIRDDLWQPFFEPRFLMLAYVMNWMLQASINKVVDEVTKEGWEFEPLFAYRCDKCGINYDEEPRRTGSAYTGEARPEVEEGNVPLEEAGKPQPPECEQCGGPVRRPDKSQLKEINELLASPTHVSGGFVGKSFKDILKETVMYNQTIEDVYWEIIPSLDGQPAEINPLPGEYIRIVVDGREKYFCPYCFIKKARLEPRPYGNYMYNVNYAALEPIPAERMGGIGPFRPMKCPDCNSDMKIGKYIQINDGFNVVSVWSEDEVIHHNSRAWGSRRYGIPKTIAVYTLARILYFQENYQEAKYSQNKLPEKAIAFPDMTQKAIQETIESLAEWWVVNPHAPRTLFLAAQQPPVVVDFGLKFQDTQAKDMALYYREAISMVYGVSLTMLGVQQPGKLGEETEQVEVSFDTIEEVQNIIEDMVNNRLVPRFRKVVLEGMLRPTITDWRFALKSPKKDDLQRRAQLQSANVGIFQQVLSLGAKVRMSEDMLHVTLEEPLSYLNVQQMQQQQQAQQQPEMEGGGDGGDIASRLQNLQPGESVEIGGKKPK